MLIKICFKIFREKNYKFYQTFEKTFHKKICYYYKKEVRDSSLKKRMTLLANVSIDDH